MNDFLPIEVPGAAVGRVETAVTAAIAAAQAAGELTTVHAGAATLAVALARGVDEGETRHSARGRAECSKELRLVLASLGLDRVSRGELTPTEVPTSGDDPFDALTRAMSSATGDPPAT